jgi:hypothetical protein
MIELVSFDSGKLDKKFIVNESISFVPIMVAEDHQVANVHSVG